MGWDSTSYRQRGERTNKGVKRGEKTEGKKGRIRAKEVKRTVKMERYVQFVPILFRERKAFMQTFTREKYCSGVISAHYLGGGEWRCQVVKCSSLSL